MIICVPFKAITLGTLSAAVYDAAGLRDAQHNPYIQRPIEDGLGCCKILDSRTPHRVLAWLRYFHKSFHSGNYSCFLDELQVALDAEVQGRHTDGRTISLQEPLATTRHMAISLARTLPVSFKEKTTFSM